MLDKIKIIFVILITLLLSNVFVSAAESILTWEAATGDITGYRLYYGTSRGNYLFNKDVGDVTQYPVSNLSLSPGNTYYFVVRAYNESGESNNSNETTMVIPAVIDTTPPLSPENVSALVVNSDIVLSWAANNEIDIAGYRVYYGSSSRVYGLPIDVSGTEYSIPGLNTESYYYFAVTAVDLSGNESGYSVPEVSEIIPEFEDPGTDPGDIGQIPPPVSGSTFGWYGDSVNAVIGSSGTISGTLGVNNSGGANSFVEGSEGNKYFDNESNSSYHYISFNVNETIIDMHKGTVSFDFNVQALADYDFLFGAGADSSNSLIVFMRSNGSIEVRFEAEGSSYNCALPSGSVTTGKWYNLRYSWEDNGGSGLLYLDGEVLAQVSINRIFNGAATSMVIGSDWEAPAYRSSDVFIDNFLVYNTKDLSTADTTAPIVSISSPTSGDGYTTETGILDIGGSASDASGVTSVTWSNNMGGAGTATGTSSWSVSGIALSEGENVIEVKALDEAGNESTDSLLVMYTIPDTTAPIVSISSPTSGDGYTTETGILDIGGSASDASGVTSVTWSNNMGGAGTAAGTSSWSVSGIALSEGENVIEVKALDEAGNESTDSLLVMYTIPDTVVEDTLAPLLTLSEPVTSGKFLFIREAVIKLAGTVSDDSGVKEVRWTISQGGNGIANGTSNWEAELPLSKWWNNVTITAEDNAGNTSVYQLTVFSWNK